MNNLSMVAYLIFMQEMKDYYADDNKFYQNGNKNINSFYTSYGMFINKLYDGLANTKFSPDVALVSIIF